MHPLHCIKPVQGGTSICSSKGKPQEAILARGCGVGLMTAEAYGSQDVSNPSQALYSISVAVTQACRTDRGPRTEAWAGKPSPLPPPTSSLARGRIFSGTPRRQCCGPVNLLYPPLGARRDGGRGPEGSLARPRLYMSIGRFKRGEVRGCGHSSRTATSSRPVDHYAGDILIEDETVSLIGQRLDMPADRVIDATNKLVMPGGIDPHTHMEFPFGGDVRPLTIFAPAPSPPPMGGRRRSSTSFVQAVIVPRPGGRSLAPESRR